MTSSGYAYTLWPWIIIGITLAGTSSQPTDPICRKPAVEEGMCILLARCPSLNHVIETMAVAEFVRQYGCGPNSEGQLRICCPVAATKGQSTPSLGFDQDCGQGNSRNGNNSPFLAQVIRKTNGLPLQVKTQEELKRQVASICTGVYITNRWVLVDGDCIVERYVSHVVENRLHAENLPKHIRIIRKLYQEYTDRGSRGRAIALLLLETPVPFNDLVQPICLPETGQVEVPRPLSLLASPFDSGVGYSSLTMKAYSANDCSAIRDTPVFCTMSDTENCLVWDLEHYTATWKNDTNGRYQLIGIGGQAHTNCSDNLTSFTRISSYKGWITEQIGTPASSQPERGDKCGNRAVGEGPENPFLVFVGYIENGSFITKCGGVIITQSWILTEASCITDGLTLISHVKISSGSPQEAILPVEMRKLRFSYNADTGQGNIAVLSVGTPIAFGDTIEPACLETPSNNNRIFVSVNYTTSEVKRVDILDRNQCVRDGSSFTEWDGICVRGNVDCMSDVKPALFQVDPVAGVFTVKGIGGTCVGSGNEKVQRYTSVESYISWIIGILLEFDLVGLYSSVD